MKAILKFIVLAALAAGGVGSAYAHGGGHVGVGVVIGGPVWGPWYYPPAYYPPAYYPPAYYPAPVVDHGAPPVYVEQTAPSAPAENYWYYCASAQAYYPYVKECPAGWQRVAPQPQPH
jgi:hypothetical protein